jgi:hypothetical protein
MPYYSYNGIIQRSESGKGRNVARWGKGTVKKK